MKPFKIAYRDGDIKLGFQKAWDNQVYKYRCCDYCGATIKNYQTGKMVKRWIHVDFKYFYKKSPECGKYMKGWFCSALCQGQYYLYLFTVVLKFYRVPKIKKSDKKCIGYEDWQKYQCWQHKDWSEYRRLELDFDVNKSSTKYSFSEWLGYSKKEWSKIVSKY